MNRFSWYIALRYLIAKKSHNIINLITMIAIAGVMIGSMALIVVLSVFNGFESLVRSMYTQFDPDLKVVADTGKVFRLDQIPVAEFNRLDGVMSVTSVVEENVLVKYRDEQMIVKMKGVSNDFLNGNPLAGAVTDGEFLLHSDGVDYGNFGYLVAYQLGLRLFDVTHPVLIYVPRRLAGGFSNFNRSFNSGSVVPSSVFAVQQEIDSRYIIVPAALARTLLEYDSLTVTSLEIRLSSDASLDKAQEAITGMVGPGFRVLNRDQQQPTLYRIMRSEKLAIFLILTFILIIASFNITGSLSLLIVDKKKDIGVLYSMGATARQIRRVFLAEGMLISLTGSILGILLGLMLCFAQIYWGLIRLGPENAFVVPYYPVEVRWSDILLVWMVVIVIGWLTAIYPVRKISRKYLKKGATALTKIQ
ncbi:MAG: FtsX-like permease family protein [Bacteroidales bacterium]